MLRGAVHKSFDFSFGFRVDPAPAVGRAPFRTVLARSVWRRHPVQRRGTLAGRAGRPPHRVQCGHEATKEAPASDHDLHLGTRAYSQDCARAPRPRACGLVSTERRGCVTPIRVTPVCWSRRGKIGHTITGAAGVATIGVRQRLDEPRRAAAAFGARGGAARRAEERSAPPRPQQQFQARRAGGRISSLVLPEYVLRSPRAPRRRRDGHDENRGRVARRSARGADGHEGPLGR